MPIPPNIEKLMRSAAKQVADMKAEVERERAEAVGCNRRAAEDERKERKRSLTPAAEILRWMQGPERARLDALRNGARLKSILLLGPVWDDGSDANGHTRSIWVRLRRTLSWSERTGPASGTGGELRTAAKIVRELPGAVVRRLARDLRNGAVWKTVERGVREDMRKRDALGADVVVEFLSDDD